MRRIRPIASALIILVLSLLIRSRFTYDAVSLGRIGPRTYSIASASGGFFVMATSNSSRRFALHSGPMTADIAQLFESDRAYIPVAIGTLPGFT